MFSAKPSLDPMQGSQQAGSAETPNAALVAQLRSTFDAAMAELESGGDAVAIVGKLVEDLEASVGGLDEKAMDIGSVIGSRSASSD